MQSKPELRIEDNGSKRWYLNDKLHRTDGPAIEWSNGNKLWYKYGELHRTDGPAIEWANGDKEWWLNGELHREDGPAIEWEDGDKAWYMDNKRYTFEKWLKLAPLSVQEKVMMRLKYAK